MTDCLLATELCKMAFKKSLPFNSIKFCSLGKSFLSNDEKIHFYDTTPPLATAHSHSSSQW